MKKYLKYKKSGIDWLGEIPEHWEVKKLKYLANLQYGANDIGIPYDEENPRYIRITDITENNELTTEDKQSLPIELAESYLLMDGDILFARSGATVGKSFFYKDSYGSSAFAGYLIRARSYNIIFPKYLYYYTLSNCYISWKSSIFIQATIQNIGANKYATLLCGVPQFVEQQQIASHLDQKCDQIDVLISKLEKQLELADEKKVSLITQAVTKGLDSTVKYKDSGIDWIGEIPEHWETKRFDHCFNKKKEKNDALVENNRLSLSYGKVIKKDIDSHEGLLPESFETYQIVYNGNIILRLMDLQNDKKSLRVGLVKEKGIVSSAYLCIYPKQFLTSDYTYYLLHTYDLLKLFYSMGGGVRQSMKFEDLKTMIIPIPAPNEQYQIASYLDTEIAKIDLLKSKITRQIELLKEYKVSLITSVVTGKIDVREAI